MCGQVVSTKAHLTGSGPPSSVAAALPARRPVRPAMFQPPFLQISSTILWLKVLLSVAMIALLFMRYRRARRTRAPAAVGAADAAGAVAPNHSLAVRLLIIAGVLFSFGVFHNLGTLRAGSFVHHGEMFHYYLGPKYFDEVGYYELYNAVVVADSEQDSALEAAPFYTDLRTYQNTQRAQVLRDPDRVRRLFTAERWRAFKEDIAFFKVATGMPKAPGLITVLMDHGYNGSPLSTFVLGAITNAVPVTQLAFLASIDVLIVIAMGLLVFRVFGFEVGALFSVYFCINALNAEDFVSGSLLRYDWLLYIVGAVCLLERKRYGWSALFLTLAASLRVFPAVMFLGIAVLAVRQFRVTGSFDRRHLRFGAATVASALALFLLPAMSLGSVVEPWSEFFANTGLHDRGVYVNHLGFRGIALFEPSHLSLEGFVEAYRSSHTPDIVRHWQNVKELELDQKRPLLLLSSLLALVAVVVIVWRRRDEAYASVLWPLLLVYVASYPAHYYYVFLCPLALIFLRRDGARDGLVPLCMLLLLNVAILVTDDFGPSPIVFYTLTNLYLFACMLGILGFELYAPRLRPALPNPASPVTASPVTASPVTGSPVTGSQPVVPAKPPARRRQPKRKPRARRK